MLYSNTPITPKALKMTMSTLLHFLIDFLSCSLIWIYNVQSPMVIPSMILLNTFFPILMIILTTTLIGPTLSKTTQHSWTLKDNNIFPPTLIFADKSLNRNTMHFLLVTPAFLKRFLPFLRTITGPAFVPLSATILQAALNVNVLK